MMKQMYFKWKYLLASILLASNVACSNNDLDQLTRHQEQNSDTRTAELITQNIVLETEGTLAAKVSEAMGGADIATLQKLVVSGPFTSTDMQFVRDSLTGLKVLDMENLQIKDNQLGQRMFKDMDKLEEVILPSTAISIGDNAFYNCFSLRSVKMHDKLESIGHWTFYNCNSLRNVEIPEGVKTIGTYAFYDCDSLSSIKFPCKLKELPRHILYDCKSLSSVILPDSLKKIGYGSFQNCHNLKSIKFPPELQEIGNDAFNNCKSLQEIQIPEKVNRIGDWAFFECVNLKELTIPVNVTFVGQHFVSECSQLRALVWNSLTANVSYHYGVGECILFVNTDQISVEVGDWKAIVINGVTEATVEIKDTEFFNVKEFKAKKLTFARHFSSQTKPGYSTGWKTIVLPFTPDSIYHESKGQIAPFNSGIEGAKPFWLRELTSEGFVDVTKIEANKPYIIAMPNHSDYLDEYRLNGKITFVARDSVLRVTPEVLDASVGPEFEFHPTYNYIGSQDVYALTDVWNYYEEDDMHYSKSFFIKGYNTVAPFDAYVTTLGGGRSSRTLFELDTRSKETRAAWIPNKTGIPQIGDM